MKCRKYKRRIDYFINTSTGLTLCPFCMEPIVQIDEDHHLQYTEENKELYELGMVAFYKFLSINDEKSKNFYKEQAEFYLKEAAYNNHPLAILMTGYLYDKDLVDAKNYSEYYRNQIAKSYYSALKKYLNSALEIEGQDDKSISREALLEKVNKYEKELYDSWEDDNNSLNNNSNNLFTSMNRKIIADFTSFILRPSEAPIFGVYALQGFELFDLLNQNESFIELKDAKIQLYDLEEKYGLSIYIMDKNKEMICYRHESQAKEMIDSFNLDDSDKNYFSLTFHYENGGKGKKINDARAYRAKRKFKSIIDDDINLQELRRIIFAESNNPTKRLSYLLIDDIIYLYQRKKLNVDYITKKYLNNIIDNDEDGGDND